MRLKEAQSNKKTESILNISTIISKLKGYCKLTYSSNYEANWSTNRKYASIPQM